MRDRCTVARRSITGLRTGASVIDIRVGIATGPMVAGHAGSEDSRNFTIMGDTVNLGSRPELNPRRHSGAGVSSIGLKRFVPHRRRRAGGVWHMESK